MSANKQWRSNKGSFPNELVFKYGMTLSGKSRVTPKIRVMFRNGAEYSGQFGGASDLWALEGEPSDIILWRHV